MQDDERGNLTVEERAAAILVVELIPGTDIMRETSGIQLSKSKRHHVLIPQPSDDPHDPLNWHSAWKYSVIVTQFVFTFATTIGNVAIAPMYPLLAKEFHLDQTQLNLLTGVVVITNGYSNFIIIPFSNIFGRRAALLFFGLLMAGSTVWTAAADSHSSLLAARSVFGVAGGLSESIMVQIAIDMFFLHERGFWMGVYFASYFLGLFIGPVIAGNMAERYGWRSFFWLSFGLTTIMLLLLLILNPETKWRREKNTITQLDATDARFMSRKNEPSEDTDQGRIVDPSQFGLTNLHTTIPNGCPSRHQFAVARRPDCRWKSFLWRDLISPVQVFLFPIIFWAALNVAGSTNPTLFYNITQSSVLASPPYKFSPGAAGYTNFAFVVGGLIGMASAGPVSDLIAQRLTLKNGGIREAEMRLAALVPYGILYLIGIIVGSVGYRDHLHWPTVVVIGFGFTGLTAISISSIVIAYAIDCYKHIPGEIMVCATVIKNTCGFAMTYWVPPLAESQGLLTAGMVELSITMGPLLLGIPMYIWGKRLRRWTQHSSAHTTQAKT